MSAASLDPCGCCDPGEPPTPERLFNRPALDSIDYRTGTYSSFRASMIESAAGRHALLGWTARDDDDYGMAIVDLWAYVADVLTFYQERIANEAFLRTAVLRDSVARLAALLGYEPAPGVAATAQLAFVLEQGRSLTLPAGVRVQSVPGPDEKPQKFETSAELDARAALNAVAVTAAPTLVSAPLAAARTRAQLAAAAADALVGELEPDEPLLVSGGGPSIEEKRFVGATLRSGVATVEWDPPIVAAGRTRIDRVRRRLRLFGFDAPPSYLHRYIHAYPSGQTEIRYAEVEAGDVLEQPVFIDYAMRAGGGNALQLDSVYDDLLPGTWLLIPGSDTEAALRVQVTAVGTVTATFGPLTRPVTEVTLTHPAPSIPDRRQFHLYELRDELPLSQYEYAETLAGGTLVVRDPGGVELEESRTIVVDDASGPPHTARVLSTSAISPRVDLPRGGLSVTFTPDLPRQLDAATAVMRGNIAEATHGETVARELLGTGDAAHAFNRFKVGGKPVTHVPRAGAPHGAASTLEVRVAGLRWARAETFHGHAAGERIYRELVEDDGSTSVEFGDGRTGARLPTGAELRATYRKGLGREGNVGAGTLTSLLEKPAGLRSVSNPARAAGGADPQPIESIRTAAPGTVRTFGRIVSLRDFEDVAREHASVAKAGAAWTHHGAEPLVRIAVAGQGGDQLDADGLRRVRADLDSRRDPYRRLELRRYDPVDVEVRAVVIARDPDREAGDVLAAAHAALDELFAFENRELGGDVHASEVYAALGSAAGVAGVDVDRLQYADAAARAAHGAPATDVLEHLRIEAHELARLAPVSEVTLR